MNSPSGRIVVAYVATPYGRDAVDLAVSLARGRDVLIDIVMVVPVDNAFSGVYPHDRGYSSILEEQTAEWLQAALDRVPEGIAATGHIVPGESEAETLESTAYEWDADLIVVGARSGTLFRSFRVGSVANSLLHFSRIPVALAPPGHGYDGPITRITAMFGTRPGASDVVALGVDRARRRGIPLRLASLHITDERGVDSPADVLTDVKHFGTAALASQAAEMVEAGTATTQVVSARSVDEAVRALDWQPGDVVIVGSSRMAARGRLFIGSTAARMLRTTPVPMIVVPQGHRPPTTNQAGEL